MTYITTGVKRVNDGKEQKYPINSHCVKVGAVGLC
jgi:hypothetical protein